MSENLVFGQAGGVLKRNRSIPIRIYRNSEFIFEKDSQIINRTGVLQFGCKWNNKDKSYSLLTMGKNSKLYLNGVFSILSGAYISVRSGGMIYE